MAAWTDFPIFKLNQDTGATKIDFDSATIKVILITNATSPVTLRNTADFIADFTECAGGNYARIDLAAFAVAQNGTSIEYKDTTTTVTWAAHASNPQDAYFALIVEDTGVDATSRVIAYAVLNGGSAVDTRNGYTLTTTSGIYFTR